MIIVLTNATLDITLSVGWWIVKKVAGGAYSLGSYLFEKQPFPLVEDKPSEADIKRMAKWFGTLEALEKNMTEKEITELLVKNKTETILLTDDSDIQNPDR